MIKYVIFHVILLLFLISLIRTIFTNPGFYCHEYLELFSITKIIKCLFGFIVDQNQTGLEGNNFKFSNSNRTSIFYVENEIKEIHDLIQKIPNEFISNACFGSENTHFQQNQDIFKEIEEYNKEQENLLDSQNINRNIFEKFEDEYLKFIESKIDHKFYGGHLTFHNLNKANSRICRYCLIKKVNYRLFHIIARED